MTVRSKLTTLQYDGVTIPVNVPCKLGGRITPQCQIESRSDHCVRGEIDQAYCSSCGEMVYQKIIR